MTKLEQIARAICLADYEGYDPDEIVTHKPPPHDECAKLPADPDADEHFYYDADAMETFYAWKQWRLYVPHARAAIEAMRELPDPILDIGADAMATDGVCFSLEPGEGIDGYDSKPVWTAMIDAILSEQPSQNGAGE